MTSNMGSYAENHSLPTEPHATFNNNSGGSQHRHSSLGDSATTTLKAGSTGNDTDLIQSGEDDLKGTFIVVTPSEEDPDEAGSDSQEEGVGKHLTLAVCRPGIGSVCDVGEDNLMNKEESQEQENYELATGQDVVENGQPEEEIEGKENVQPNAENMNKSVENIKEQSESDGKQLLIKPKTRWTCAVSTTRRNKPHAPVIETDENAAIDGPAERNNEVAVGQRRSSAPSPGHAMVSPPDTGPQRKQSTEEAMRTGSSLSVDNAWNESRPRGRRAEQSAGRAPANCHNNRSNAAHVGQGTTNGAKRTRNNVKAANRISHKSSRCHRDPTTNARRGNTTRTPSDGSVSVTDSVNSSEHSGKPRPTSVFEQRYTTRELRAALPRRCFFSCHDRALKDAGLGGDDPVARRKAERLKARLERIANEFSPLPSAREQSSQSHTNAADHNGVGIAVDNVLGVSQTQGGQGEVETAVAADTASDHDFMSSAEAGGDHTSKHDSSRLLSVRPARRKRPDSATPDHVDCKPLLHYLEYVRDNKEEYLNHLHSSTVSSSKTKPTSRLVSLGKAFELRHRGGIPRRYEDDDVILMAAKALRPRSSDPARYARNNRDRMGNSANLHSQDAMRQGRPTSEDKRKQDKNPSAAHSKEDEHAKSEMERRKHRAEEWTKTVSTNTLTRAKIQSLRELGGDDHELAKWWEVFKDCRYLRDTWPVVEGVS